MKETYFFLIWFYDDAIKVIAFSSSLLLNCSLVHCFKKLKIIF